MNDYRLGLYEKAIPAGFEIERMLEIARRAGFDFLELSVDETDARLARLDWTPQQRAAALDAVRKTGLPLGSLCLSAHRKYPLGSHDPAIRARGIEIFERAVELACELGIRIIQLAGYDVYYETGDEQTRAWFSENLRGCVDFAAKYGVSLGFETMETPFMDTVEKAMRHVRAVGSPYLGVYPDLGNLTNAAALYGTDLYQDIASGAGRLLAMHLKETRPGQYRDMRFGEGHVDFKRGTKAARELGVRLFVAEYWHLGSADYEADLAAIRAFLDAAFLDAAFSD